MSPLQLKLPLRILEPQKLTTFRLPCLEGTRGQATQSQRPHESHPDHNHQHSIVYKLLSTNPMSLSEHVRSSSFSLNNSSDGVLTPFSVTALSIGSLGNSCPLTLSPRGPQSRPHATGDLPSPKSLPQWTIPSVPRQGGGEPEHSPTTLYGTQPRQQEA